MTPVIYRKYKQNGDILALFPSIPHDHNGYYCESYQHIGQHGGADYVHCIGITTPATPAEYADLHAELIRVGYDDLKVYQRVTPIHHTERFAA
tara:strand:- start:283 stop:561 length:279 start_codon:yes stop_codon:yes gene_type:complete